MENELFKKFDSMSYCELMASEKPKLCDYVMQLREISKESEMRIANGKLNSNLRSMQLPMESGFVDNPEMDPGKFGMTITEPPSITHKYKKRVRKPKQR